MIRKTINITGCLLAPVCAALILCALLSPAAADADELNALLVRQLTDIDGNSKIQLLLDGEDISGETFVGNHVAPVPAIITLNGKTRAQAATAAQRAYIDTGVIHTYLGHGAATVAEVLGLNGAIIQMQQQLSLTVPATGETMAALLAIEGYTFVPPAGGAPYTAYGGARLLPAKPRHIVAHYFPAAAVEEFWLDTENRSALNSVMLTIAAQLTNALVYRVYDTGSREPIGAPVTLTGYHISISAFPAVPADAVAFNTDPHAVAKCIAGIPPVEIARSAVRQVMPQGDGLTVAAPIGAAECPNHGWDGEDGAPRSLLTLLERHGADYALLAENTALQPAEWNEEADGVLSPVTRLSVVARQLSYSCYYLSYRQTVREIMPLAARQNIYFIAASPATLVNPLGAAAGLSLDFSLAETVVTANVWGEHLTLAVDEGIVSVYMPYRWGNEPPTESFLAPYLYDSDAGVFYQPDDGQKLPAFTYSTVPPTLADNQGESNISRCVSNHQQSDDIVLNVYACRGWHRNKKNGDQLCSTRTYQSLGTYNCRRSYKRTTHSYYARLDSRHYPYVSRGTTTRYYSSGGRDDSIPGCGGR